MEKVLWFVNYNENIDGGYSYYFKDADEYYYFFVTNQLLKLETRGKYIIQGKILGKRRRTTELGSLQIFNSSNNNLVAVVSDSGAKPQSPYPDMEVGKKYRWKLRFVRCEQKPITGEYIYFFLSDSGKTAVYESTSLYPLNKETQYQVTATIDHFVVNDCVTFAVLKDAMILEPEASVAVLPTETKYGECVFRGDGCNFEICIKCVNYLPLRKRHES